MLRKLRESQQEDGFTLIELLVVVIIIGILAAIAIPVFLAQRERAWRSASQSDLRNAAVSLETYYTDEGFYAGDPAVPDGAFAADFGFNPTANVVTAATYGENNASGEAQAYCLSASHINHEETWFLGSSGTLSPDVGVGCPTGAAPAA